MVGEIPVVVSLDKTNTLSCYCSLPRCINNGNGFRGGSRIFLRRGAALRNGSITDWLGKQILKANRRRRLHLRGCTPLRPPHWSALGLNL